MPPFVPFFITLSLFFAANLLKDVEARRSPNPPKYPCHIYNAVIRCYNAHIPDLEAYFSGLEDESRALEITHSNLSILSKEPFLVKTDWQILHLAGSNIRYIDYGTFRELNQVVSINLEGNLLSVLHPSTFAFCYLLLKLILRGNPLILSGGKPFLEAYQLEYLDLSYANLTDIPVDSFRRVLKLKYLNISHNRLEVLNSKVFMPLYQLEVLDIARNNFKVIDYKVFSIYSLTQLNNEWICDCDLKTVFYQIFENNTLASDAVRCERPFNTTWTDMKSLDCAYHVPNKTLFSNLNEYYTTGVNRHVSSPEEQPVPTEVLLIVLFSTMVIVILIVSSITAIVCWCRTKSKTKINHPEEHCLDTSWQYGTVLMHRQHDCGKNSADTLTISAPILQSSTVDGIPLRNDQPSAPLVSDLYQRIDSAEHDTSYSDQEGNGAMLYERMN